MTKILILIMMLALLVPQVTFASKKEARSYYQSRVTYSGPFKADRIYQLKRQHDVYYPSSRFSTMTNISCGQARSALRNSGRWAGNLSDSGACLGFAEGMDFALGNFLNYQSSRSTKKGNQ